MKSVRSDDYPKVLAPGQLGEDRWVAWERDAQGRLWATSWSGYRCLIDEERHTIAEKVFVK